jgi:hypothetical protein
MKYTILLLTCAACGGGLSSESKTDIKNATNDTAAAYQHEDPTTAQGALVRGAHCAMQAVIRNEKLDPIDSGIPCQ